LSVVEVSKGRKLIDPADLRAFIEAKKRRATPEDDDGPVGAEPLVEEIADDARARAST